MKKKIFEFVVLLLVWIVLEFGVFNFDTTKARFIYTDQVHIDFGQEEMTKINWTENGEILVSEQDPQLIFEDLNQYIGQIEISYESSAAINDIAVFYTTDEEPVFSDRLFVQSLEVGQNGATLNINSYVKDLRVDLGDTAGVSFKNIHFAIMPLPFQISIARLVAILFIFYMSKILFAIQAPLDFGFDMENEIA